MPFEEVTTIKRYPVPLGAHGWFWFKKNASDRFELVKVIAKTKTCFSYIEDYNYSSNKENVKTLDCIWGAEAIRNEAIEYESETSSDKTDGFFTEKVIVKKYPNPQHVDSSGWFWFKAKKALSFEPVYVSAGGNGFCAKCENRDTSDLIGTWGEKIISPDN